MSSATPADAHHPDDLDPDALDPDDLDPDALDPDAGGPARPGVADLAWVFLGGTAGTTARAALSLTVPPVAQVPVIIAVVNIVGAFLLGLLLERLHRAGPDTGRRRTLRLALGTGVLGGFTTYSALAADTVGLLGTHPGPAIGYAVGTLVVGGIASLAGIVVGSRPRAAS